MALLESLAEVCQAGGGPPAEAARPDSSAGAYAVPGALQAQCAPCDAPPGSAAAPLACGPAPAAAAGGAGRASRGTQAADAGSAESAVEAGMGEGPLAAAEAPACAEAGTQTEPDAAACPPSEGPGPSASREVRPLHPVHMRAPGCPLA